jgi:hypothetical protein
VAKAQAPPRARRQPEDPLPRLRETQANLYERLENGYQHLNRPKYAHLVGEPGAERRDTADQADRRAWERWFGFWKQLLGEYERVCDQIAEIESQGRSPHTAHAQRGGTGLMTATNPLAPS